MGYRGGGFPVGYARGEYAGPADLFREQVFLDAVLLCQDQTFCTELSDDLKAIYEIETDFQDLQNAQKRRIFLRRLSFK